MTEDYYQRIKKLNITHYSGEVPFYSTAPLRSVEEALLAKIDKNKTILDVGCGSGRFTIGTAQKGYNVTGLDITPDAINAARSKVKRLKLETRFDIGDMTEMPYEDETFDVVICPRFSINAIATFDKQRQAVSEMYRVVKRGGKVFIESFNKWYLGKGLVFFLKNLGRDYYREIKMLVTRWRGKQYEGLLPGDIVYPANKVVGATDGYAHLPTALEWKRLLDKYNYTFLSIPQMKVERFDFFKYFRYSLWIVIKKER